MREYLNLSIRKKMRMSEQGYERLGAKLRAYYLPFIYPTIWSGKVSCPVINNQIRLAQFVYERVGGGLFVIMKNRDEYSRGIEGFKKLAKVKLIPITESKFDYEFLDLKGIGRYDFWEKEY